MKNKFHLVLIGSMTRDRIIVGKEDSKQWDAPGGGVYYGAFPPVIMNLKVGVITKLAKKDSSSLKEFEEEGIKVFPLWARETTRMENVYPDPENPDKRISKCIVPPTPFTLQDIPADIKANIFHISALVKGEIPIEIVKEFSKKGIISLDAQGFMRKFQGRRKEMLMDRWEDKGEILSMVNILKVDRVEAEILTGEKDPQKALRILSFSGVKEIVLTHNKGVMVYAQGEIYLASFTRQTKIEGRTGRGDTVMGAYLCERLLGTSLGDACSIAAWVCSLKMSDKGPYSKDSSLKRTVLYFYLFI